MALTSAQRPMSMCIKCLRARACVSAVVTRSAAAQVHAANAAAHLATRNLEAQNAIAAAGAVPLLVGLLANGKAQMPAAGALSKLAASNAANQSKIAAEGGIASLLSLLNVTSIDTQVSGRGGEEAAAVAVAARESVCDARRWAGERAWRAVLGVCVYACSARPWRVRILAARGHGVCAHDVACTTTCRCMHDDVPLRARRRACACGTRHRRRRLSRMLTMIRTGTYCTAFALPLHCLDDPY